eukprot:gnl/MRDRNA2_/MRDRNA2_73834_c0_seq4.p1 gnl/MRDRNA2_/MRDRNA2_73834_c0~~gnl/MRDRNA2_/MRDRNA2_73834_c0_seq4.p1  ORF type:complete len:309 (-),score=32.96 gnl/MRDRNA2_/MRDRNA2_73834_c0_seq4:76-1002(-)
MFMIWVLVALVVTNMRCLSRNNKTARSVVQCLVLRCEQNPREISECAAESRGLMKFHEMALSSLFFKEEDLWRLQWSIRSLLGSGHDSGGQHSLKQAEWANRGCFQMSWAVGMIAANVSAIRTFLWGSDWASVLFQTKFSMFLIVHASGQECMSGKCQKAAKQAAIWENEIRMMFNNFQRVLLKLSDSGNTETITLVHSKGSRKKGEHPQHVIGKLKELLYPLRILVVQIQSWAKSEPQYLDAGVETGLWRTLHVLHMELQYFRNRIELLILRGVGTTSIIGEIAYIVVTEWCCGTAACQAALVGGTA